MDMVRFCTTLGCILILQACVLLPSDSYSVSGGTLDYLKSQGQLPNGVRFRHVSAAENTSCALSEENEIWCWGEDLEYLVDPTMPYITHTAPYRLNVGQGQEDVDSFELGNGIACFIDSSKNLNVQTTEMQYLPFHPLLHIQT